VRQKAGSIDIESNRI